MSTTNVQQWPTVPSAERVLDVQPMLAMLFQRTPNSILSRIQIGGQARQNKHIWYEDVYAQQTTTLSADISAHSASATGLTVNVADATILAVGDRFRVNTISGPVYEVTAVSAPTVTFKEVAGVALGSDAGSGELLRYTRGQLELTSYGSNFNGAQLGEAEFNYTQIFRRDVQVSRSQQNYARANSIYPQGEDIMQNLFLNAAERAMIDERYELYEAIMNGIRTERASTSTQGYMGGIRSFVDVTGGNVISASGTLTLDNLDNAVEAIYTDTDGDISGLTMVTNINQNQAMQALDATNFRFTNPAIPNRDIGGNVSTYIPNISASTSIPIIIDQNLPNDVVYFLDFNKIMLMPVAGEELALYRADTPGTTATQGFIYGEYTLAIKNAKQCHAIIKGLS